MTAYGQKDTTKEPTRQERVLEILVEANLTGQFLKGARKIRCDDGWVDGAWLAQAWSGGSEGLRRLRELRAGGWEIDKRMVKRRASTIGQYRLADHDAQRRERQK